MRKFWKKTEGFTLVELIVVIAVLGILAGVGTVGYSGYVKKANMQADMTLVSNTATALQLHALANSDAGPLVVVLNAEGTANQATGESAKAMEAAFGADWANSVGLKYDGWTGASNMAAYNDSNYMQSSTMAEKMQDVTDLASKATDFLNLKQGNPENMYNKLKLYLGNGFETFCNDNGIATENGAFANASSEQLTNLMGLYVANDLSKVDKDTYQAILLETVNGVGDCINSELVTSGAVSSTTYLAAQYALISSVAAAPGEDNRAERLAAVDAALGTATNMGGVQSAINSFFWTGGIPDPNNTADMTFAQGVLAVYGPTYFDKDAKAISSVMGVASSQAKNYYNDASDLTSGEFFKSPAVVAGLNGYVSAAEGLDGLTVGDGAVILYTDGVTSNVVVTPDDAYLVQ